MYGLVTTVAPTVEPVTLALAKLHARIDLIEDDALVSHWITAAREYAEEHTGRAWVNRTVRLTLPKFPWCQDDDLARYVEGIGWAIRLPLDPVSSVTSVKYYDADGTQQTWGSGNWQTWLDASPPLLAPGPLLSWPTTQPGKMNVVEVIFVAGYGTASGWPARANEAIYLALTYWERNRGGGKDPSKMGLPDGAIRLLDNLWNGAY